MLLSKDAILNAQDLKFETVPVPEWGGEVRVKTLSGLERDAFEQAIVETKGKSTKANLANIRAKLCARTIVDDAGARVFEDADVADLGRKSGAALDRVYAVAARLSGINKADVEELAGE